MNNSVFWAAENLCAIALQDQRAPPFLWVPAWHQGRNLQLQQCRARQHRAFHACAYVHWYWKGGGLPLLCRLQNLILLHFTCQLHKSLFVLTLSGWFCWRGHGENCSKLYGLGYWKTRREQAAKALGLLIRFLDTDKGWGFSVLFSLMRFSGTMWNKPACAIVKHLVSSWELEEEINGGPLPQAPSSRTESGRATSDQRKPPLQRRDFKSIGKEVL